MDADTGAHGNCGTILAVVITHHQANCRHDPCGHQSKGESRRDLKGIMKKPNRHLQKISSQAWGTVQEKGEFAETHSRKGGRCWHQEPPGSGSEAFDTEWEISGEEWYCEGPWKQRQFNIWCSKGKAILSEWVASKVLFAAAVSMHINTVMNVG